MKKSYLLVFNSQLGTLETVKNMLNGMPMVEKWRYDLPNAFYIVSQHTARQIAEQLYAIGGKKGMFILTEIPGNSWGWLTNESWYLIQNHEYKPK